MQSMTPALSFFVDGQPRAKQSFRVTTRRGRRVAGYTPAPLKAWQRKVGSTAQQAMSRCGMDDPLQGNLTLELIIFLKDARIVDNDNLSKAVQDGLNKIAWADDHKNIRLVIDKYICRKRPGVMVKIYPNDRAVEITEKKMEKILNGII